MQQSDKLKIISLSINRIGFSDAITQVAELGLKHQSSFVCFANAHMTIEAYKNASFLKALDRATYIFADGAPIAKACSTIYHEKQQRIAGMDFMPALIEFLNQQNKSVRLFLLGSTQEILIAVKQKIADNYPNVELVGSISPPFRDMLSAENKEIIETINQSGAHVVFISFGCPKQEKWMAENHQFINAVLLGVGGAFSVFAGLQPRAPIWMQKSGLEWFYRLKQEPKRLFMRYLYTNTLFILLYTKEIVYKRLFHK